MKKMFWLTGGLFFFGFSLAFAGSSIEFAGDDIKVVGNSVAMGTVTVRGLVLTGVSTNNKVLTSDNLGNASWQASIPEVRENFVAAPEQTVFTAAGIFSPTGIGLKVYVSGVLKTQVVDYSVVSGQQITFVVAMSGGEAVTMLWGYYSPQGAAGGALSGTYPNPTLALAVQATNLAGGSVGRIAYQSAIGVTSFVPAGTATYVLQSGGPTAPSWINATTAETGSTIVKRDAAGAVTITTVNSTNVNAGVLGVSSVSVGYVLCLKSNAQVGRCVNINSATGACTCN